MKVKRYLLRIILFAFITIPSFLLSSFNTKANNEHRSNGANFIKFIPDPPAMLAKGGGEHHHAHSQKSWKKSSVLKDGNWYKIGITRSGVYKIDYAFLKNLGLHPDNINPQNLKVFGNGGGMLPQSINAEVADDLVENPVYIKGEGDKVFNQGDHILFYGKGPHSWRYLSSPQQNRFRHRKNDYWDTAYYFITHSPGKGKRIKAKNSETNYDHTSRHYDVLQFHEKEVQTAITDYVKSGRDWFGESFGNQPAREFTFNFPGLPSEIIMETGVAARANVPSNFSIKYGGKEILRESLKKVNTANYEADYASVSTGVAKFTPNSGKVTLSVTYNKPYSNSNAWLNYISLNGRCKLKYNNEQFIFRDKNSTGKGNTRFLIESNTGITVWDITEELTPQNLSLEKNSGNYSFIVPTDTLRKFLAFTPGDAYQPIPHGRIPNQNLHAEAIPEMILITAPSLKAQALSLAQYHQNKDNMKVLVTTPQKIYNEFSSGAQDITAIRNFVAMFYHRAASTSAHPPKYLLLFGDASYDYKNRLKNNTNLVPTYQTPSSFSPINSFPTDDYYGYLEQNEGQLDEIYSVKDYDLDIAIGRLPVNTPQEAKTVVNKIKQYSDKSQHGDWRNMLTFIADDQDRSYDTFIDDAEELIREIDNDHPVYNFDKIYMDAYQQVNKSNGQRYPDAKEAMNRRINKGTFLVNYIGHGGEAGLAHERILEVKDVQSWTNKNALTLFITATCEFTRFDDPERISAGEYCLLNPNGGAVALLSTTRLVWAASNQNLMRKLFFKNFFEKVNGRHKTLGEIITDAKNRADSDYLSANVRKFTLIGDPALNPAFPEHNIVTTRINRDSFTSSQDSLKALGKYSIQGEIQNTSGKKLSNFDGIVYPTIYDKPQTLTTLGNDPQAKRVSFKSQNNIIYRGKATVKNGKFNYKFVVPKDISYKNGFGKISYYASNDQTDANGYSKVIVGGTADSFIIDNTGPRVKLYINDENFQKGGLSHEDPLMIAKVFDENGINTVAMSIGHEPKAFLDNRTPVTMKDAYQALLDTYKEGKFLYRFNDLHKGHHTLRFKVWDVANNSGEGYTEFIVADSDTPVIRHLFNYPNPFSEFTNFSFEHNQPGEKLHVNIKIYNNNGHHVRTIDREVTTEGTTVPKIRWEGTGRYGQPLGRGIYIYQVTIYNSDGAKAYKTNKMVLLK